MRKKNLSPEKIEELDALRSSIGDLLLKIEKRHLSGLPNKTRVDEHFVRTEIVAEQILYMERINRDVRERAGVPDTPTEKELTRRRGSRVFLEGLAKLRRLISTGDTVKAVLCGIVIENLKVVLEHDADGIYEAALCGDKILRVVRGPRSPRRHPFLMNYLRERRRKNGKLKAKDILDELKKYDSDYPLRIKGRMPGTIWYDNGALEVSSLKHGGDETITPKIFREYFRACKGPPTLTK